MVVSSQTAQETAMAVFLTFAQQPDLMQEFMAVSGLAPQDLRGAVGQPFFASAVMDFLMEDDRRVLEAAAATGISTQDLMRAHTALAGPGTHGWQVD